MRRVAIDVDDTVIDFMRTAVDIANWQGASVEYHDFTSWDLRQCLTPEQADIVYGAMPYVYSDPRLRPIPHAYRFIRQLRTYAEVVFVTAGVFSLLEKQRALWRFGFLEDKPNDVTISPELIVASDKTRIDADVLIDDKPSTIQTWIESDPYRYGFLFKQPWNGQFTPTYTWLSLAEVNVREQGRVIPTGALPASTV